MASKINRSAGVLMPIFSLPSPYGIGCFGKSAYEFVDWLCLAGMKYWQVLPLNPTSYGDSPYQSPSTFAGNPYFIDVKELIKKGLLNAREASRALPIESKDSIDYEMLYKKKMPLLRLAFSRFDVADKEFNSFVKEQSKWLVDYALFMAIKDKYECNTWYDFPKELKFRKATALKRAIKDLSEEIKFYEFLQYEFYKEWGALKKYANNAGVKIIGDMPLYVALDSADVWANASLFKLDDLLMPISEYYKNEFDQHETEIRSFFDDNGLFGDRGNVKGSYLGSLVINAGADPIIIPMYAGTATDRTISERLREHAVNFYNDSFKFTGVRPEELKSGKISYSFDLRAETADYDQAKKAESMLILTKKPYLQYSCFPKFFKSEYTHNALDICIDYKWRKYVCFM